MVNYKVILDKNAEKDKLKIANIPALKRKADEIINLLRNDPFTTPPSYEKLQGDLKGAYSRRLNIQHRIVYQVYENEKVVKIIIMWTHYE